MTRRKNSLKSLVMGLLLAFVCPGCAQVTGSKVFPLHVEASFESGTSYHKMMPMGAVADLGYYINRFSLHAVAQGDYFLPKEGNTYKYNNASNIGGGLGFVLFPENSDNLGIMELRALMTTSVSGSKSMENNSYKVGLYWYGSSKSRKAVPLVSLGYTIKNFHSNGVPTYRGAYVSLGVRF